MATNNKANFTLDVEQTCNNHGAVQPNGSCICSAPWIGDGCQTSTAARAAGVAIGALAVLLLVMAWVHRKCIDPYLQKRHTQRANRQRAVALAHPITVRTLAGDTYTLTDWGLCKDLKAELFKVTAGGIGDPSTFERFGADSYGIQRQIEGRYGSDDRNGMTNGLSTKALWTTPREKQRFKLTLLYQRDERGVRAVVQQKILRVVSQSSTV